MTPEEAANKFREARREGRLTAAQIAKLDRDGFDWKGSDLDGACKRLGIKPYSKEDFIAGGKRKS